MDPGITLLGVALLGTGGLGLAIATVLAFGSEQGEPRRARRRPAPAAAAPGETDRYDHHDHAQADRVFGGCGDPACPTGEAAAEVGGSPRPAPPAAA